LEAGVRGDGIDGFSALVASVKGVKRGREGIRNYVCKRVCVRARVDAAGRGAACLARGNAVKNGREGIRKSVRSCVAAGRGAVFLARGNGLITGRGGISLALS